jgi:hypothetical protein
MASYAPTIFLSREPPTSTTWRHPHRSIPLPLLRLRRARHTGAPKGAQSCHRASALPTPTPFTGESLAPHAVFQSTPPAAMSHFTGHFSTWPEAWEAVICRNRPCCRWAHSRSRCPVTPWAPHRRVGVRRVREEVLVFGVVSPVHLGRRRPRDKLAVPRAPCTSARCRHALVPASAWASLLGRNRLGHCGARLNSGVFHFLFDLV